MLEPIFGTSQLFDQKWLKNNNPVKFQVQEMI